MATKKLTKQEVLAEIEKFKVGAGTVIVAISTPEMRKTGNPFYGRVTKVTRFHGVQLGTDFQSAKEKSAQRSGVTYQRPVGTPTSRNMKYYNRMVLQNTETGEYYLPVQWTEKSFEGGFVGFDYCYLLDHQPMTHSEFKKLQEFIPEKKDYVPADQRDFNDGEVRKYLTLKLDNVLTIQQGQKLLRLK